MSELVPVSRSGDDALDQLRLLTQRLAAVSALAEASARGIEKAVEPLGVLVTEAHSAHDELQSLHPPAFVPFPCCWPIALKREFCEEVQGRLKEASAEHRFANIVIMADDLHAQAAALLEKHSTVTEEVAAASIRNTVELIHDLAFAAQQSEATARKVDCSLHRLVSEVAEATHILPVALVRRLVDWCDVDSYRGLQSDAGEALDLLYAATAEVA